MSQFKHSLNSAYIVLDLLISATPIRIFHLIYPMLFGSVYTLFNALYFLNNGVGPDGKPYAYYVMDWRNPIESSVTCSLGFIMTTVVQVFLYGIYRARLSLYARYMQRRNATTTMSTSSSQDHKNDVQTHHAILTDTQTQHHNYNALQQMQILDNPEQSMP